MKAAGYPDTQFGGGSEVMHYIGDLILSKDGWMSTVYHRVISMYPYARYVGYGNGKNKDLAVDVLDFDFGPTAVGVWLLASSYPQTYPVDGQSDIPIQWYGNEYPDPLPPGATRPVGYPFTLQGVNGTLVVDWVELHTNTGRLVSIHPNPSECQAFNCYGVIAVKPLEPDTTYIVSARGSVGGLPFDRNWTFTTQSSLQFHHKSFRQEISPGPPWFPSR